MRNFIKIVESAPIESEKLACIEVSGILGTTLEFKNIPLQNQQVGAGNYGYLIDILRGKRWLRGSVSPMTLSKANVSLVDKKITGGIWFFEKDRTAAEANLRKTIRELLMNIKTEIDITLHSALD